MNFKRKPLVNYYLKPSGVDDNVYDFCMVNGTTNEEEIVLFTVVVHNKSGLYRLQQLAEWLNNLESLKITENDAKNRAKLKSLSNRT